ncbi:uncharacterized protein LOC131061871 [Cryptomeria japonica]|uniref:uncharacterized protein LOC131061871 n=1 Tax=Cryptomeria japonica TaxID=3369 RepID=UPI0027DA259A|nr:uncharacterized protein LOC131061871 [Cryptomeria japonica]
MSSGGKESHVPSVMDFCTTVGSKPPLRSMKTFNNKLFSSESGSGTTGGSHIMKINGCLERYSERSKLVIPLELIVEDVEKLGAEDLAPEGEMEIMMLENNYFMLTFNCMEVCNRVFEGGPYFYNQVGLFIKPWHAGFNPSEELPNKVVVWVHLPCVPMECYRGDVLRMLAALLGKPVGSSTQTLGRKAMAFSRICVEIDLSKHLPNAIDMSVGSYSWVQQLDYETLPFRCHLYHDYGHL